MDSNGTGVTARHVKKRTLEKLFSLNVGVGTSPVNEFENCGELLAGSFPVLFPYGVGAPGMLSRRGPGVPNINLADHAKYLMEHVDQRFAGHRLFPFGLVNMLQRHAACYAAKAVANHKDLPLLQQSLSSMSGDDLASAIRRLEGGEGMDGILESIPEPIRRVLSKINIVGHTVPGSPHARRKLLPELYSMIHTLGPPTLFVTINPYDCASPVLMHWATGKGDLDAHEPLRGILIPRLQTVAQNPALAARYFHEMCTAFQDILLGAANEGFGIFGRTTGYYGVTEAQGRGTLHCHYVVWLEGAGTGDGIKRAVEEDVDGLFRKKLVDFFDGIMSTSFVSQVVEGDTDPTHCNPPECPIPRDATECTTFKTALRKDAEWVASRSNMHKIGHTASCYKSKRNVCRFGFPKQTVAETHFDDTLGGMVGHRADPWLNSFNIIMASTLRCNHDVK